MKIFFWCFLFWKLKNFKKLQKQNYEKICFLEFWLPNLRITPKNVHSQKTPSKICFWAFTRFVGVQNSFFPLLWFKHCDLIKPHVDLEWKIMQTPNNTKVSQVPPRWEQKLKFSGLCIDLLSLLWCQSFKRHCDGSINCAALWNFQLFEPIIFDVFCHLPNSFLLHTLLFMFLRDAIATPSTAQPKTGISSIHFSICDRLDIESQMSNEYCEIGFTYARLHSTRNNHLWPHAFIQRAAAKSFKNNCRWCREFHSKT